MKAFAIYRMPNQSECVLYMQCAGELRIVAPDDLLGDVSGFVIAPFDQTEVTPRVVIPPDSISRYPAPDRVHDATIMDINAICAANAQDGAAVKPGRYDYFNDFERFHRQLLSHRFDKVVLSRLEVVDDARPREPFGLFVRACGRYPRMFVCLLSTPATGTWLISTPELLIGCHDGRCTTMALAGTMKYHEGVESEWRQKDRDEQRLVAEYIDSVVRRYGDNVEVSEQYTSRAGGLVHLRNDFCFDIDPDRLGALVDALYPTPAVCGLPKEATRQFIIDNEFSDRRYYSGYCGPLNADGNTDLYVALRCMSINTHGYDVYAGGGLLSDSSPGDEWAETCAKMETMLSLL